MPCCKWNNCAHSYPVYQDLIDHVVDHILGLSYFEEEYVCQWSGCSTKYEYRDAMATHIIKHARKEHPVRVYQREQRLRRLARRSLNDAPYARFRDFRHIPEPRLYPELELRPIHSTPVDIPSASDVSEAANTVPVALQEPEDPRLPPVTGEPPSIRSPVSIGSTPTITLRAPRATRQSEAYQISLFLIACNQADQGVEEEEETDAVPDLLDIPEPPTTFQKCPCRDDATL